MRPSLNELIDLWRYTYARSSLIEAKEWLEIMHQNFSELFSPVFRSLTCSTVIAYARPFTKSQVTKTIRLVPLKDISPPLNLTNMHEKTLEMRDKVFGHKDATKLEEDIDSPNKVIIKRDSQEIILHNLWAVGVDIDFLQKLKSLCDFFQKHCESKINPLIFKYGKEILSQPLGSYELLINESPMPWFMPYKESDNV